MKDLLPETLVPFRVAIMGLVFFAFFIGLIFYVFSARRRARYEEASKLPLDDGQSDEHQMDSPSDVARR